MRWAYPFFFLISLLTACVPKPEPPPPPPAEAGYRGLLMVNEGQWTQNNATIDFYDPTNLWRRTPDVFKVVNGTALGDVANHALRDADTLFIVMNNSLRVYKLQLPSLKLIGQMATPAGSSPRRMLRLSPTKAYLTSLLNAKVYVFNPVNMTLTGQIDVQNYMEDVVLAGNKVFVTCGSYTPALPGQTLAVIDPATDAVTDKFTMPVVNPGPMQLAPDGRLWVGCRGDFAGGGSAVSLVNPQTLAIDTTLHIAGSLYDMIRMDDDLVLVTDSALSRIYWPSLTVQYNWRSRSDLNLGPNDLLYTVFFDAHRRELYITNAGVGAEPAKVSVFTERGVLLRNLPAGLFPSGFIRTD